jgi:hypothetical protein
VRVDGLEPSSLAAANFKSAGFTNFPIPAILLFIFLNIVQ